MKTMLYVGHAFHNRTGSTQFLQEIFATKYAVEKFDFDPYTQDIFAFSSLYGKHFDVVVLFQIMPPITSLQKIFSWDKIVFFPMYDATHVINQEWNEYKDVTIINFSRTLHETCLSYGFSSFFIQFFPKPQVILDWGAEDKAFLWQRREKISLDTIDLTLGINNLQEVYYHLVPDPGIEPKPIKKNWLDKVKVSTWFETKCEMIEYMQQCAIYYAPRTEEGFGNSYLDAMSLGRCVIAANNPAMNEYIEHGVNGFLYDCDHPKKISIKNLRDIQKRAYEFISEGYEKFEKEKWNILDWIETNPKDYVNEELLNNKLVTNITIRFPLLKIVHTQNDKKYFLFGKFRIR